MSNIDILVQAPIFNLQLIIEGLLIGAIFALAAYGLALVWGVMNIINVSTGEFVMLGGFVAVYFHQLGIHPIYAVPAAAVLLYLVGYLLYRVVVFRIIGRDMFISILATFGLSIILQQLMNQVFGPDVRTADAGMGTQYLFGSQITVSEIKVVAFVLAIVVGALLAWFLKFSRLGQAIRATAQDARAARVLGIDTDRVYAQTFALAAAICGSAGALVAMAYTVHPYFGLPYTVRSFMIVVVAGLGNLPGVIIAGMTLAIAEIYAGFVLGTQFQLAFVFGLLVAVLVWRSQRLKRKRQFLE
ncbi:MAG: branched-chain amino acid ABC transporter permease [Halofilum sp. (in: g-proteobacteria)]|nr:branched-chain amino acid ABC transporter permease [Halofilum sp. (in: g-proteobacteria)]